MLELDTEINIDYIVRSCWSFTRYLFLEKVLTIVLISFLIETRTQPQNNMLLTAKLVIFVFC